MPGSSAFGAVRFLQEFAGLLFEGSVSSAASGSDMDFFLFGLHASFPFGLFKQNFGTTQCNTVPFGQMIFSQYKSGDGA